jgi:putative FmdB family regulatory protein
MGRDMPTYDYECGGCGHGFELFQSITDRVRRKCPECGALKLKRLIGPGGAVIFKGSGFYQTDYRSDSYKKAAEAEKKPAADKSPKKKDPPATGESKSADSKKKKGAD